jgi:hypothetical protein
MPQRALAQLDGARQHARLVAHLAKLAIGEGETLERVALRQRRRLARLEVAHHRLARRDRAVAQRLGVGRAALHAAHHGDRQA